MVDRDTGGTLRAIVIAGVAALAACTPQPQAPDPKADVEQLTALSDAWDKAIVRKDRAAIADNMADDFRQIDGTAKFETKTSFVDGIMDGRLEIDPYTVEDFEVRLYGDVALLSGRSHMTGRYDGAPFAHDYRYIDVYVRRDGAWKIVSVQITRIPVETAAPQ